MLHDITNSQQAVSKASMTNKSNY